MEANPFMETISSKKTETNAYAEENFELSGQ